MEKLLFTLTNKSFRLFWAIVSDVGVFCVTNIYARRWVLTQDYVNCVFFELQIGKRGYLWGGEC